MGKYLIHVGLQDKTELLWQIELFHYAYDKYIDKSIYDVQYCVSITNEIPYASLYLKALEKHLPIIETKDYTNQHGSYDPLLNKYYPILDYVLPSLSDRHLIVMDSDILLLPAFNDWWRLLPNNHAAYEVNAMHRERLPGYLQWYNGYHKTKIKEDDCVIAPCFILQNGFVEEFMDKYMHAVKYSPDKRAAMMCAKGVLAAHYNWNIAKIPQFTSAAFTLDNKHDIWKYTNVHYFDTQSWFNKRMYQNRTPFGVEPPEVERPIRGYSVSEFIWETIQEYVQNGRRYYH